ncbi:MAG: HD domain-containing protein [Firmicutes bacterium]|nr:HD domain-containing protein [Bacillota bacterium]
MLNGAGHQLYNLEPLAKLDRVTEKHAIRVARLCLMIGRVLGLAESELNKLRTIGLLHDLGKIAYPKEIIAKPWRLTEREYEMIKFHPTIGANMARVAGYDRSIVEAIWSHHERLDGSGYPRALKGRRISLFARIVAVADTYEAMTAERPYRKALPPAAAIKELKQADKYDRKVVQALITALGSPEMVLAIAAAEI